MKKLLIAILIILPLTASAAWYNPLTWFQKSSPELSVGGPSTGTVQYVPTVLPLNDNQWDLGTSTKVFRNIFMYNSAGTTRCLQITSAGLIQIASAACGSGGGGSGGGTFSTTTLGGQIIQYPYTSLITSLDSDSTTTSKVYFDPINQKYQIGNANTASTTILGNLFIPSKSQGFAYLGSNSLLSTVASSSILLQDLGGAVTDAQVPDSITVTLASTATALAANGANCSAGSFPLGVDASGAVESCAAVSISGITNGNNLADLTATDSTLTFSGAYNGGTARTVGLNLGNANTWTALQTFGYASSTGISTSYASSTFQTIGTLTFGGVTGSAWSSFCTSITGSADLCDGNDASGGGGSSAFEIATTSDIALSQVAYINKTAGRTTLASVATSSVTINAPLTSAGTPGYVIGGSGWTLDVDDIGSADLASADFGSFTCNGTTCSLDSGSVSTTNIVGGSTNTVLQTNGADIVAWAKLDLANQVTGTLPIANGGTATTTGRYQGLYFFGGDVFRQASTTGLLDYDPARQLFTTKYSSSTDYASFLTASSTFANIGTLSMSSLANSFPYFNSSGTAVATTSPVFYERMFSNWASTTPNFNSTIYASGATSTLKIYLPRAINFTAIGGSIRTGTSLLCEIGNGTASSTRVLTTTAGQTSDSVTLAGEVTVACGSGSGNPDDANFTVLGEYSK